MRAGLDTQLELRQAEGQLPQARVAREQAQAAADLAVHELAALDRAGADAYASIKRPVLDVQAALPVPTALPINLLARRPDVLSARLNVAAADAQRLGDKAAFYPDMNLQALAGIGAFGLNNLVQWSAHGYGAGPRDLAAALRRRPPARRNTAAARRSWTRPSPATTTPCCMRCSRPPIRSRGSMRSAREQLEQQQTLEANEAAYKLAEERYRAGLASYLSVLNAETQVLTARQTMVDILASQAVARVTLLLAVGGSFDPHASGARSPLR